MAIVFNTILSVIGVLTSIATIASFVIPLIGQRIFHIGNQDLEVKRHRRKILRIVLGLILIITSILITVVAYIDQQMNDTPITYPDKFLGTQPDSIAWSPDSTQIATADQNTGGIKIWDVSTDKNLLTYQPPSIYTSSLAWSPDGKYIAANVDGELYILQPDAKMLHRVSVLETCPLPSGPSAITFSANGTQLSSWPNVIAWSLDGMQLAIACTDNVIRVLNIASGQIETSQSRLTYSHHTKEINSLTWSPNGRFIASSSLDNTIQIWNLSKGDVPYLTIKVNAIDSQSSQEVSNVIWSPDGKYIALVNSKGILMAWDIETGKSSFTTQRLPSDYTFSGPISWSPDSQLIAAGMVGTYNNVVQAEIAIININYPSKILETFSYDNVAFQQDVLAWSPNQEYIAATSDEGVVLFPSNEDDTAFYVVAPVTQDIETYVGENFLLVLIEAESAAIGLWTLYKAIERRRFFYISDVKKGKVRNFLQRTLNYILMLVYFVLFSIVLFVISINNQDKKIFVVTFAFLVGIGVMGIVILPSVVQRYLLPLLRALLRSSHAKRLVKGGYALEKQKKYYQAIAQYDHALVLAPRYTLAYANRGYAYLKLREYQWALDDFNQAFYLDPQRIGLHEERGDAYYHLKEYKNALEDYNKAVDTLTETRRKATLYFKRGNTYLRLRNILSARLDFLRSSDLDPTFLPARLIAVWISLGKKLPDKETLEQVAIQLKEIADRDPQKYAARLCSGLALAFRGNVKSGLKEVEQAISQSPRSADAYFWQGMLLLFYYRGKSHVDDVMKSLEQALDNGLPPVLLTPLYWYDISTFPFFADHIQPLLQKLLESQ